MKFRKETHLAGEIERIQVLHQWDKKGEHNPINKNRKSNSKIKKSQNKEKKEKYATRSLHSTRW